MKSNQERRLLALLNSPDNRNKCCECSSEYPTWASCNLGIFLCGRCASAHRKLGNEISIVKSLSLDHWTSNELDFMGTMGNRRNHHLWNNRNEPFPYDDDDKDSIIMYLRAKYVLGRFRTTQISPEDYHLDMVDSGHGSSGHLKSDRFGDYDDYGSSSSINDYYGSRTNHRINYHRNLSYRGSNSGSRDSLSSGLTHNTPSSRDKDRYGDIARKMKFDMGYEDTDLNIEALSKCHGNIDRAIQMIKDYKDDESTPPPLPKRKSQSNDVKRNVETKQSYDWLDSDTAPRPVSSQATSSSKGNSIYQYVDPNTGAYYYIDGNGQQYVDPTQQQQQQQMQQLQAQQTAALQAQQTAAFQQQQLQAQQTAAMQQAAMQQSAGAAPTLNQMMQMRQLQQGQQMQQTGMMQPAMQGMQQTNMQPGMQVKPQFQMQRNTFTGF